MKKLLYLLVLPYLSYNGINAQSVVVNSDGTHSVGVNHGSATTIIHPDGTHSIGINHGNTTIAVSPDGTHSIGIIHGFESDDQDSNLSNPLESKSNASLNQEDMLFTIESITHEEELYKLKILLMRNIIRWKEYRTLKTQSRDTQSESTLNKANQIFELHKHLEAKEIRPKVFSEKKKEIILPGCH